MPSLSPHRVNRIVLAAVVAGFAIVVAAAVAAGLAFQQNLDFTERVAQTRAVQQALFEYALLNERLEVARRGFLLAQDDRFTTVYREAAEQLPPALDRVADLTSDNPNQQQRVAVMRGLLADQLATGRATLDAAARGERLGGFGEDSTVLATRRVRTLTAEMASEESELLATRDVARAQSVTTFRIAGLSALALLALMAVSSVTVLVRYTRDLAASRAELTRLNSGLEEAVKERTADLQRANDEIQRFAYIVSHDLRSPLVNVMGFTTELEAAAKPLDALVEKLAQEAPQLLNGDAQRAVQEDIPESLRFIRTSTQKMDRLINAILQLSRQGRRVLTRERIDLNALLAAQVASLQHRLDELGGRIEVAPDLPGLVSDRLALEQVLANLLENALKYRKPGVAPEIQVRARVFAGRVLIEVQDNGRGIDPKDHERIFELFRRSGAQDQPGEGIGLAHVRALTYRLGGLITLDSKLGEGATFRVSLPLRLSEGTAA
jgi:signal transduction histidine kinase